MGTGLEKKITYLLCLPLLFISQLLEGLHCIPFILAFPRASPPHVSRSSLILSTVGSRYWTQLILDDLKTSEWSPGMWSNQMTDGLSILSLILSLLSPCLPNRSLKYLPLERETGGMNKNRMGFLVSTALSALFSLSWDFLLSHSVLGHWEVGDVQIFLCVCGCGRLSTLLSWPSKPLLWLWL